MFPKFFYAEITVFRGGKVISGFTKYRKRYARTWRFAEEQFNEDIVSEFGFGWSCCVQQISSDDYLAGCKKSAIAIDELMRICDGEVVAST